MVTRYNKNVGRISLEGKRKLFFLFVYYFFFSGRNLGIARHPLQVGCIDVVEHHRTILLSQDKKGLE